MVDNSEPFRDTYNERLNPEEEEEILQGYLDSLEDLCDYDPTKLAGLSMGMLHCPQCGCMILAGVSHPKCDPDFCGMSIFQK